MTPLIKALSQTAEAVKKCHDCGNLDVQDPCRLCQDMQRQQNIICVVSSVADLWAIERTGTYKGQFHILEGVLSALDGIGPEDLRIQELLRRVEQNKYSEIILALSATVDGQSTAHYITDKIVTISDAKITRLAHGMPVGGELDYLDEGTITTALRSRANV